MLLPINLNKNIYISIFFFIFFVLGIYIFPDYGISIDEDNTRIIGFLSLKYINSIFLPENLPKIDEIINSQLRAHEGYATSGIVFDLPMAFLEFILKIEESRQYYLLRHFFNFLIFFVSVYFFFLIIHNRFKSWALGILGSLFLILSPRIFANSFFNNKDIVFMSLFIISLYMGIKFIEKKNIKNAIIFSILSAIAINLRIFALILPTLILLLYIENISGNKNNYKNLIIPLLVFLFLMPCFIILFEPNLWSNPVGFFSYYIKNLSEHNLGIYNYYLGKFISTDNPPWHYSLIWIFVTTPILYIFFFLTGFFYLCHRTIKRWINIKNNEYFFKIWSENTELQDLIFLVTFLIPLIVTTYFGSVSYDGWRHLYFIYPSFLLIAIIGFNFLKNSYLKKWKNFLYISSIVLVLFTGLWMYNNHPFQYVYFNFLAGKNFNEKFEMDYSGVSNKNALEYIISKENKNVKVHNLSTTDLILSREILDEESKKKIKIVGDISKADYLTNNFRDWNGNYKPSNFSVPYNFEIMHEIKVNNVSINTIYKKL